MNDTARLGPKSPPPEVRIAIGVATTVLGALPTTFQLFMSNFENVNGLVFIVPIALFFLAVVATLVIHIAWMYYMASDHIGCVIAQASLIPGGLNTMMFAISAFYGRMAQ